MMAKRGETLLAPEVLALLEIEATLDAVRPKIGDAHCAQIESQVRVLTDCIIAQQKHIRDLLTSATAQIQVGA